MGIRNSMLRYAVYPALAKAGMFRSFRKIRMKDHLTVVTYHGVVPRNYTVTDDWLDGNLVRPETFHQHLRLLKSEYAILHPDQFYACLESNDPFPPHSVLLTCDDGLVNHVTEMLPILREERVSCLFFVMGDALETFSRMLWHEELYLILKYASKKMHRIPAASAGVTSRLKGMDGRKIAWGILVKELSKLVPEKRRECLDGFRREAGLEEGWMEFGKQPELKQRFGLLSRGDLMDLKESGMTLGSHTCTHPVLSFLPKNLVEWEMEESRRRLEKELEIRVWALSYPFGDSLSTTQREERLAERVGYKCAFVNFGGLVPPKIGRPFSIERVHVSKDMTLGEFEAHISGFHHFLRHKLLFRSSG